MPVRIEIKGAVPLAAQFRFREPINWTLREGEQWAVVGPNGAGKSTLAAILQGRIALREGSVRVSDGDLWEVVQGMEFHDIYSLSDSAAGYYQQRWNSADRDATPLAGELLGGVTTEAVARSAGAFDIRPLLERRIVSLSSGELRKLLIMRVLARGPQVLVLDNPYIGLDSASRGELDAMLAGLVAEGMQMVLLLSDPEQIPAWVNRVLPVRDMSLGEPCAPGKLDAGSLFDFGTQAVLPAGEGMAADFGTAVRMDGVTVRYGQSVILKDLDWQVRRGEKWALAGPNGSGKSTLLSLVTGDNPQAYANRITLFDRVRGTGESIWDIKRRIGYLTPDLHTCYRAQIDPLEVVVSGFHDSVGLFRAATAEQMDAARAWLGALGGVHLAGRSFVHLSFGEQRLVLLARAMVKDPPLLILDEPLHGLDAGRKRLARALIDAFCRRPDKTLIFVTHYPGELPASIQAVKTLHKPPSA